MPSNVRPRVQASSQRVVIGALLSLLVLTNGGPAPVSIRSAEVMARGLAFGMIMSAALAPDGSVYIADQSANRIYHVSPAGSVLDTIGNPGAGPGEFGMLYRLGVRRTDGELLAYDALRGELSRFTSRGTFISRHQVPYMFTQVDDIVPLDDGTVAISGTMSWEGFARDSAVHVFDTAMVHVRSFGPLPPVKSLVVRRIWGAGNLTSDGAGGLWYSRRLPYELYHYSAAGKLLGVIRAPFKHRYGPDEQFIITETGARRRIATNRSVQLWRPTRAIPLFDGSLLAGRADSSGLILDLFDRRGTLRSSGRVADIKWLIGVDPRRHAIWYASEDNLEPVIKRGFL